MSLLEKISSAAVAPISKKLMEHTANSDVLKPLAPVNINPLSVVGAYAKPALNAAFGRTGMALMGAGLGAAGVIGGKYLYDKYFAEPKSAMDDPEVIEALIKAEQDRKNAKLRELGIAGASLTAGLVLPEVLRMGSRAVPFVNSDFDADDIRKMMRD
jgi:hypothetical protein